MTWHFASMNVAKLSACLKGWKTASEGGCCTKREHRMGRENTTRKVTVMGKMQREKQDSNRKTDSLKDRRYKKSEFTSYTGRKLIYWTLNGEIWHKTKDVEPEGFLCTNTTEMASNNITVTFSVNQNNAIHFISVMHPPSPQSLWNQSTTMKCFQKS